MALDSMIGGGSGTAHDTYVVLSSETKLVLDAVIWGGSTVPTVSNIGTGSFGLDTKDNAGEIKSIAYGTKGSPVVGTVTSGSLSFKVDLPADVTLAATGVDGKTSDEVKAYGDQQTDKYLGGTDADSKAGNADIKNSIKVLADTVKPTSTRVVALPSSATSKGTIVIDAGTSSSGTLTTLRMPQSDNAVELRNMDSAVVLGNGKVSITNGKGAVIAAGLGEQSIQGGSGGDTIVTTGGRDTMAGGAGSDTFATTSTSGDLRIDDFKIGEDKLAFKIDGVSNVSDLAKLFTGVTTTTDGGSVLHFGNLTITLVGVSPSTLTLDMLKFSL